MDLKERTREIRRLTMQCIASIGVGHVGGCMSIAETLSVLYTNHMRVDPKNPQMEGSTVQGRDGTGTSSGKS